MARMKTGIDYFPMDVNFLNDIKSRRLLKKCGASSITVLIYLFTNIYRDEGYFMPWSEDICFLIADEVRVEEEYVQEVVDLAISVGLFDKNMYEDFNILTSTGIQNRYKEACSRRKEMVIEPKYDLNYENDNVCKSDENVDIIDENEDMNSDDVYINGDNVCRNLENVDRLQQRKGKESKVKEKKGEESKEKESREKKKRERGKDETSPPISLRPDLSPYGKFNNVFLTADEHAVLTATFENSKKLIDKISTYLVNAPRTYQNHFALICKIADEDGWAKKKNKHIEQLPQVDAVPMPEDIKQALKDLFDNSG